MTQKGQAEVAMDISTMGSFIQIKTERDVI
jgi:hypothetical protein